MTASTTSEPNPVERKLRRQTRKSVAMSAALLILELDPEGRCDLTCYMDSLTDALREADIERQDYIVRAIGEVLFANDEDGDSIELAAWTEQAKGDSDSSKRAWQQRDESNRAFMKKYTALKDKGGFETQRQVADACGLSINTVNAIEQQKVKPQSRTIQKLARGLGVNAEELLAP